MSICSSLQSLTDWNQQTGLESAPISASALSASFPGLFLGPSGNCWCCLAVAGEWGNSTDEKFGDRSLVLCWIFGFSFWLSLVKRGSLQRRGEKVHCISQVLAVGFFFAMPVLPKSPDPKNGNANLDTLAEDGGRRSSLRRDASAEERAAKGARVGSSPGGLGSASAGSLGGSVGVPSGSQGEGGVKYPGGNFGSLDLSLKALLKRAGEGAALGMVLQKLEALHVDVNLKFTQVEQAISQFKAELSQVKLEMVTKETFANLENRVQTLETRGAPSPEVNFLKKQVSRLDPANKAIRILGLKATSVKERTDFLDKILKEAGLPSCSLEHIYKGPASNRVLTDICLAEFSSNSIRETALNVLGKKGLKDPSGNELKIDRAKTAIQIQRNNHLRKALDILKKDTSCVGKTVEIIWQQEDKKDKSREVWVDKVPAFRQTSDDLSGSFLPPFQLSL